MFFSNYCQFLISSVDNNLNLTNTQYLDALIPAPKPVQQQLLLNAVISMEKLKLYSLSDQIQTILRDGKVINFDLLMRMLDNAAWSADLVLQTLPSVGMLVQGNWTVLSEILYPTGTLSGTNGVPAELMCRARDYVVSLPINLFVMSFIIVCTTQLAMFFLNIQDVNTIIEI